jgi:hypothetical protein
VADTSKRRAITHTEVIEYAEPAARALLRSKADLRCRLFIQRLDRS